MQLFNAHNQWQTRPADERFSTVAELDAHCRAVREQAATAVVDCGQLAASDSGGELVVTGPGGRPAGLTHFAFGQLANRCGAPPNYLRSLPIDLAAANLNCGLQRLAEDDRSASLLLHANGGLRCRAFLSERYSRIWNADITAQLVRLADSGWRVPPARPALEDQPGARPATAADILPDQAEFGLSVKIGDTIAPAGLYASDQDMFAFMVLPGARIDDGSELGLARGFFVANSETGAAAFKLTRFLYRAVCGNHIVWGAQNVSELRIVHTGAADSRWGAELRAELVKHADSTADDDRERVIKSQRFYLGENKDSIIAKLFAAQIAAKSTLELCYTAAEQQSDENGAGSPRSAWGFAQGMTAHSQTYANANRRAELDRAAGRVMAMAF